MKRSTGKIARTPFVLFAVGKICFMVGVPRGAFFSEERRVDIAFCNVKIFENYLYYILINPLILNYCYDTIIY